MGRVKDLVGKTYGRWTVLCITDGRDSCRSVQWLCKCSCGNESLVSSHNLSSGRSKSCGCLKSELTRERQTLKEGNSNFNEVFGSYKYCAASRNYSFELSEEKFKLLTEGLCHYCGAPPSKVRNRSNTVPFTYNGIDRVDNNVGYEVGNCVTCCRDCNTAKMSMTREDYIEHCRKVVNYNE